MPVFPLFRHKWAHDAQAPPAQFRMNPHVIFESPEFLAAVPAAAAIITAVALASGGPGRLRSSAGIFAALALAAVAASGPAVLKTRPVAPSAVFIIDSSSSGPDSLREASRKISEISQSPGFDRAELHIMAAGGGISFADLTGLPRDQSAGKIQAAISIAGRDGAPLKSLDAMLSLARARASRMPSAFLLFSPGFLEDVPAGPGPSLPAIHVFPLNPVSRRDVAVLEILVSGMIREGRPFSAGVRFASNFSSSGTMAIFADGAKLASHGFSFAEGDVGAVEFQDLILPAGKHELEARFETGDDFGMNDSIAAGAESRRRLAVLVVASGERAATFASALAAQEIDAVPVRPYDARPAHLRDADVVVLDSPGSQPGPSAAFLSALAKFVQEDGGGLLVVSGMDGMNPPGADSTLADLCPLAEIPDGGMAGPAATPDKPKEDPPPIPPVDPPPVEPRPVPSETPQPGPQGGGDKKPVETGNVALVIALDKSGSMTGEKLELAKQAAAGAVDELLPGDLIGVVAFDSRAWWAVPLSQADGKDRVAKLVAGLEAGDGTNILPALMLAHKDLRDAKANIRHVVLISDGFNETVEDFKGQVTRMAADGISISTIGVGLSFDPVLLSSIAWWSKGETGRFDFAKDFDRIPKLVLVHARWARGIREGPGDSGPWKESVPPPEMKPEPSRDPEPNPDPGPGNPAVPPEPGPDPGPGDNGGKEEPPGDDAAHAIPVHPSPALAGIEPDAIPQLRGIRKSVPHKLADVLLLSSRGDPVFAVRNSGKGMVAAFAADLASPDRGFGAWNLLGKFLAQTAGWLAFPGPADPRPRLAYSYVEGGEASVGFLLDEGLEGGGRVAFEIADASGKAVSMDVAGSGGWHSGRLPGPFRGPLLARLSAGNPADSMFEYRLNPVLGSAESRRSPNLVLLRRIASASGGMFNPNPGQLLLAPPAPEERTVPLAPILLVCSAFALVFAAYQFRKRSDS